MQSLVQDDGARAMLFDLDQTILTLGTEHGIDCPHAVSLTGRYHNLMRRWAES